ncbi:hypothetical protein [Sinorhizobium sp. RAC02]|uniref:hypothetical protein n=1 Tax=Sinorhizobium sp. RAC02 TaxID=1842534 RepID=UPI0008588AD1|nr:hypothetical protein [Sinorhizobium sp. RAC02]AOF91850.1 hypothetical protein BSY16_3417 [Sinorhizobium sp. RAC02]
MARRGILSITAVAAGASMLAGCSYLFVSGVEGAYTATGFPLHGQVSSRDEREGGTLRIGSVWKQECEGEYVVSVEGASMFGVSMKDRIYRGQIYCLDGRVGRFELVSARKGRTGSIKGEIGGDAFQLRLIQPKREKCDNDECRWGLKWTYENERRDMQAYRKVEAEHKARLQKPETDKAVRSVDGM